MLQYYRGRLKQALVTVFPNIGLEKDLFKHPQSMKLECLIDFQLIKNDFSF